MTSQYPNRCYTSTHASNNGLSSIDKVNNRKVESLPLFPVCCVCVCVRGTSYTRFSPAPVVQFLSPLFPTTASPAVFPSPAPLCSHEEHATSRMTREAPLTLIGSFSRDWTLLIAPASDGELLSQPSRRWEVFQVTSLNAGWWVYISSLYNSFQLGDALIK